MSIFEKLESNVRTYSRSFPAVFEKAKNALLYSEEGKRYIDFFAGAGSLNYGHNPPEVSAALIAYLQEDGILLSLDKETRSKKEFLEQFSDLILTPRNLEYRVQFTGPTGANAIEAALKLSRTVKKRRGIIAFTNAFHGLTQGALSVTGNSYYRNNFSLQDACVSFMPYDNYFGPEHNTASFLRRMLEDPSSGIDIPAAIILEAIQAEGGVNVASRNWLKEIQQICIDFDILLIVDDIQVGNGRSGSFFSFEDAGISPDIVVMAKSIGGGLPMSLVLIKPEHDQWKPGEHTGTFRGNNLAFVASISLLNYWKDDGLKDAVIRKSLVVQDRLQNIANQYKEVNMEVRGKGLIQGLKIPEEGFSCKVSRNAFKQGLIIETAGPYNEVLKLLPPLTIEDELLLEGLDIIEKSVKQSFESQEEQA
ncbi:diaminobutyrate--2-oxoglutarate aminotransferase [Hydrocoleum sp. CS-953]|uniref:diaminobutyrate--2-oxoglutarate transaminase n=1 Tax=Hydrocoleum sp. CS-953 TaxID=1671698 RepID=UPI000B9AEA12|nr:diaminobutyrate--2-oxoglutarate transaminase [Hydrocoleum sp. CS-953]OZH51619.1 diaminobutyrate--2-oxoglutarate aminotransferase [Hydrocoleum sp. CS-953]